MGKTYTKRSKEKKFHDPSRRKPKKGQNLVNDYNQRPDDDFFANSDSERQKRTK